MRYIEYKINLYFVTFILQTYFNNFALGNVGMQNIMHACALYCHKIISKTSVPNIDICQQ
jgi:hypothetical protein